MQEYISHTLCYEELTFAEESGTVYKDLALLAHNRVSHHELYKRPDDDENEGEE